MSTDSKPVDLVSYTCRLVVFVLPDQLVPNLLEWFVISSLNNLLLFVTFSCISHFYQLLSDLLMSFYLYFCWMELYYASFVFFMGSHWLASDLDIQKFRYSSHHVFCSLQCQNLQHISKEGGSASRLWCRPHHLESKRDHNNFCKNTSLKDRHQRLWRLEHEGTLHFSVGSIC